MQINRTTVRDYKLSIRVQIEIDTTSYNNALKEDVNCLLLLPTYRFFFVHQYFVIKQPAFFLLCEMVNVLGWVEVVAIFCVTTLNEVNDEKVAERTTCFVKG